ncbi:MAG: transketolase C-terminal domain-containing protein [bacterium]
MGNDKNILIISYGQLLHEVVAAQKKLEAGGIKSSIMNFNAMNNFSINNLQKELANYKHIFVIEDHFENS